MIPVVRNRRNVPSLWDEIASSRSQMDRVFSDLFGRLEQPVSGWYPAVDVRETDETFVITAELPGLDPNDVDVSVEDGTLLISGEKKTERTESEDTFHLSERTYGRFERSFTLPRSVDANKVEADFRDGVLHITLPKAAESKPRRIEVKTSAK